MSNKKTTTTETVATTTELVADNTPQNIANFKSNVAKAVDADDKAQNYRATALRNLSLIGLETMTEDVLTTSDITTYAQETLCAKLGLDWKDVADKDNLLATRGIFKEVVWVLTYLNASGAACDPDGNEAQGICITDGKKKAGRIWIKTKYIPRALREEDAPPVAPFSFKNVLTFSKAYFAKDRPSDNTSDAYKAFTHALSFVDHIVLAHGEVEDDHPDDKVLAGDAELLVKALLKMSTWMQEAIDQRNVGYLDQATSDMQDEADVATK
jgi:hypothetical protein